MIVYHQTHHGPNNGPPISILPLLTQSTGVTHVMIAAIHLNDPPGNITLNDLPPDNERFTTLWSEVAWLQASGVRVLGMLGGAAKGSFERLDGDDLARVESFYAPLRDMIREHALNGLDLDIEEEMSLPGVIRLIDRLRADFGPDFIITLAPVSNALLAGAQHLSGFDYRLLETMRGHEIAWYNTQFYCGWGDASTTAWYDAIMSCGWPAHKVVLGLVTNPANGPGHVDWPRQEAVLRTLRSRYPGFGGVMGWEYYNSLPGDAARPWEWAANMARTIRTPPTQQMPIRPFGVPAPLPTISPSTFPPQGIQSLKELGMSEHQAIAALIATGGNVEMAAALLFQD